MRIDQEYIIDKELRKQIKADLVESYEYSRFILQRDLIEYFIKKYFGNVFAFLEYYGLSLEKFNQFMSFEEFDMINYETAQKVATVLDLKLNELYKKW